MGIMEIIGNIYGPDDFIIMISPSHAIRFNSKLGFFTREEVQLIVFSIDNTPEDRGWELWQSL